MPWHTYILQCADESYYVGHTHNLKLRLKTHNEGTGARYTKARRPVTVVYSESFPMKAEAIARENQIKKWSRAKKTALIQGRMEALYLLSRRRSAQ